MSEILQIGNPVLRQVAKSVEMEKVASPEIQNLIDQLLEMVISRDGVGISAPQINHSLRIIVVASRPNHRYPQAPFVPPMTMINPRIINHSSDLVEEEEGCLSVRDTRANVLRYRAIELEYYNREGKLKIEIFQNFIARIIQHEIDHLNGILFVDRIQEKLTFQDK